MNNGRRFLQSKRSINASLGRNIIRLLSGGGQENSHLSGGGQENSQHSSNRRYPSSFHHLQGRHAFGSMRTFSSNNFLLNNDKIPKGFENFFNQKRKAERDSKSESPSEGAPKDEEPSSQNDENNGKRDEKRKCKLYYARPPIGLLNHCLFLYTLCLGHLKTRVISTS